MRSCSAWPICHHRGPGKPRDLLQGRCRGVSCCFPRRCVALRSTSPQKSSSYRATGSLSTGGPWASSSTSSWWAASPSSETPPRSSLGRSSAVSVGGNFAPHFALPSSHGLSLTRGELHSFILYLAEWRGGSSSFDFPVWEDAFICCGSWGTSLLPRSDFSCDLMSSQPPLCPNSSSHSKLLFLFPCR